VDSHVKERIVGAAVLVALGVWLIPWVLDGPESEPVAVSTPELALPSPDSATPVRTETVDLAARSATSAREQGDAEASPGAESQPPTAVRTSRDAAAEPAAATTTATATRAGSAPPAPPATVSAPDDEPAGWSVQVGAFSDRANAVQLADRIADFGYRAQVSEFLSGGRPMHRVRVDGFATRAQAEAASSSLSAHGFPARVATAD
jgi:cell division septation protein DedD